MNNNFFDKFKSKIKLNIKGKKIERFLQKLIVNQINLYDVKKINRDEVNIVISKQDYLKVYKLKSIYELNIIDGYGFIKIKKVAKINSLLIFFLIIGIISLYILSKVTFSIDIIHTSPKVRQFIMDELNKNGIKLKTFKKSYNELQKIKDKILEDNKNTIEWLEIESIGTKYIVRLEERKIKEENKTYDKQNVVATKDAIIKRIEASNGQIVKEIDSYVRKGDVVISGNIMLNDQIKDTIKADGTIYGEVWYQVKVSYPLVYKESHETGKSKKTLVFHFLNKEFSLNSYKNKKVTSKVLMKHPFLPIFLTFEEQKEVKVIDEVYTIDEAIKKAEEKAYNELTSKLNDKEKILTSKNLKVDINDSKIELDIFFSVYEDITGYEKIDEIIEE